ncbi:MAG: ribosome assembly RNA-binding protein YhbY [Gammaproteobacteria bacterium]
MILTKKQIKYLRSLAHDLSPVVRIGQNGLTENVLEEVKNALEHHELIKLKINVGERQERDDVLLKICEETKSRCIQKIGNTATLFRRNPQKPVISLAK